MSCAANKSILRHRYHDFQYINDEFCLNCELQSYNIMVLSIIELRFLHSENLFKAVVIIAKEPKYSQFRDRVTEINVEILRKKKWNEYSIEIDSIRRYTDVFDQKKFQ